MNSSTFIEHRVLEPNWTFYNINWTTPVPSTIKLVPWYETGKIQIPLYAIIFMLAVVGNTLIILTLAQNRRMRTVTNLFLLNLAISDLLLGVLCMPFTLIGALLRDFVFGEAMCKLIPFLQGSAISLEIICRLLESASDNFGAPGLDYYAVSWAYSTVWVLLEVGISWVKTLESWGGKHGAVETSCSVSVGAWTLVAISVERYYAICHPLRSLAWQTVSHAYKTIIAIWIGSFICMIPIVVLSELKPTKRGNHKCRENWPSVDFEKAFNLFLDIILMVFPLMVLAVTYSLIIRTLWKGIKTERAFRAQGHSAVDLYVNVQGHSTASYSSRTRSSNSRQQSNWSTLRNWSDETNSPMGSNHSKRLTTGLRRTNAERSLYNKKRVIKMLCVVVMEFFICWTPLYIINTVVLFDKDFVYNNIGYIGVSFFQLLAYSSSCCNPITYCFMNTAFRKSFQKLFKCLKPLKSTRNFQAEGSDYQMDLKYINNRCSDFA